MLRPIRFQCVGVLIPTVLPFNYTRILPHVYSTATYILCNPKVHYGIHKIPLIHIVNYMNYSTPSYPTSLTSILI